MLLGALLLIAPLSAALTVAAVDMLAGFVGVALDDSVGLLVSLGAAVVGLEVAAETAAVRLHGFAVLDRGGRSRCAIRYASVGATVLSGSSWPWCSSPTCSAGSFPCGARVSSRLPRTRGYGLTGRSTADVPFRPPTRFFRDRSTLRFSPRRPRGRARRPFRGPVRRSPLLCHLPRR